MKEKNFNMNGNVIKFKNLNNVKCEIEFDGCIVKYIWLIFFFIDLCKVESLSVFIIFFIKVL